MLGVVQTTGLFLALAFLSSGYLLYIELKRRANLGDLRGVSTEIDVGGSLGVGELLLHLLLGMALGYKGIHILTHPNLYSGPAADKAIWSITQGSWWGAILGALFFVLWKIWEKRQELKKYPEPQEITQLIMPHDRVGEIVLIVSISGVTGSKLLYLLEYSSPAQLWQDISSWSSLSLYGGLIASMLVLMVYAQRKAIAPLQLLDALAPILFLAYGLGRLGSHLAGNGYWGLPAGSLQAYLSSTYPNNIANEGVPMEDCYYLSSMGNYCLELPQAVYTIGLWEFVISILVFILLWAFRGITRPVGLLFAINLVLNGAMRWGIEQFRVEGLGPTEVIALGMIAFGGIMSILLLWRKYRSQPPQP